MPIPMYQWSQLFGKMCGTCHQWGIFQRRRRRRRVAAELLWFQGLDRPVDEEKYFEKRPKKGQLDTIGLIMINYALISYSFSFMSNDFFNLLFGDVILIQPLTLAFLHVLALGCLKFGPRVFNALHFALGSLSQLQLANPFHFIIQPPGFFWYIKESFVHYWFV